MYDAVMSIAIWTLLAVMKDNSIFIISVHRSMTSNKFSSRLIKYVQAVPTRVFNYSKIKAPFFPLAFLFMKFMSTRGL